jgi:tetratricopeptide (TPR) repeat protein
VAICLVVSCASKPKGRPAVTPSLSLEQIQARLGDADAMAARGCYLCLKDAADAYAALADLVRDPFTLYQKTLENDLMIALREFELRLPDSGARDRAQALRQLVKANDDPLFAALDLLTAPAGDALSFGRDFQQQQAVRQEVLLQLESQWAASPVAAYFYLALGRGSIYFRDFKLDPQRVADGHPQHAALQYSVLNFAQRIDTGVFDQMLAVEPRFAELHVWRGQRALLGGDLATARREFFKARELLPASLMVASGLAPVEFAYSHYSAALGFYEEVLARIPDPQAQLGKAEALSYLLRHQEAIAELDDLLTDPSRRPGDKYYWRAWNKLQLADFQPAYEDATTALKFMNGPDPFRLAGITTFAIQRLPEARGYFESAVKMFASDCDSIQYIGQLDAAERKWPAAATRFSAAADCFEKSIALKSEEIARKEAQNSGGLLDDQIARLRSEIESQKALQAQSVKNAAIAAKNVPPASPPAR